MVVGEFHVKLQTLTIKLENFYMLINEFISLEHQLSRGGQDLGYHPHFKCLPRYKATFRVVSGSSMICSSASS